MLGSFNEKQLEEIYNQFVSDVRANTLSGLEDVQETKAVPNYSEKAIKLFGLLQDTESFGCQRENVKKLVEILLGEDLPPIVKKINNKREKLREYHKRLCVAKKRNGKEQLVVINAEDESINSLFETVFFNPDEIIRLANPQELDSFFSFTRQLINVKGGFNEFFDWLHDDQEILEDFWDLFFTQEQWDSIDDD